MQSLFASIRLTAATLLICVGAYTLVILGVARIVALDSSQGSLIVAADGRVVGSSRIAQAFTEDRYFWPRPSAAGYNASAAAGSNKSPTSADLTERARELVQAYGASAARPLPADLAAASGAGLDPHISERAALYQVPRVAQARALEQSRVQMLIADRAFAPGAFLTPDRIVNVLELNIALDALDATNASSFDR